MRKLVYYIAVTIDGYIADAHGGFDAFLAEGDHGAVVLEEFADALPAHAHTALGIVPPRTRFDTVIMGWNTLTPALTAGIASPYPHLHQVVASRYHRSIDPDITLTDDPLTAVHELKQQSGLDIWLCGGGELAGALLPEIDSLVLKRNPLVFGSGIPLFSGADSEARNFELIQTRPFSSGVIVEEYAKRS